MPLIYLISLLPSAYFPNQFLLTNLIKLIFVLVAVLGLLIWITAYLNLGLSFAVLPMPRKIVKKGLYRYLRHPMYLGISATFLSLALLNESVYGLSYTLFILIPILLIRARLESREIKKLSNNPI